MTMAFFFFTWHANARYSHSHERVPLPEKASVSIELQWLFSGAYACHWCTPYHYLNKPPYFLNILATTTAACWIEPGRRRLTQNCQTPTEETAYVPLNGAALSFSLSQSGTFTVCLSSPIQPLLHTAHLIFTSVRAKSRRCAPYTLPMIYLLLQSLRELLPKIFHCSKKQ